MKTILIMTGLAGLAACSDSVVGEPLIASTLTGDFDGDAFTPKFGFARDKDGALQIFVGTSEISCADDFMGQPRNGTYVGLDSPATVGSSSSLYDFIKVTSNSYSGGGSNAGLVAITALDAMSVTATLTYDATPADTHYALSGDVTLLRCPAP